MAFINLHQHSEYSNASTVLDSTIKIEQVAPTAFELGWSGVALTDHNIMGGHLRFLNSVKDIREAGEQALKENPNDREAQRAANFKGVLGTEVYLSKEGQSRETHQKGDRFYHFVLLAKDRTGWEQLNKLSQLSWGRFYKSGRVNRMPNYISDLQSVIGANPGHVIGTSACLGSYLGSVIQEFAVATGKERETLKENILGFIYTMKDIFGDDFYLELQPNQDPEQLTYNNGLVAFAEYTDTKFIVALDAHYRFEKDRKVHSAYLNSQDGVERETDRFYKYTYMMEEGAIKDFLETHLPEEVTREAIDRTMEIYEKIEVYDITHSPIIPQVPFRDEEKWSSVIYKYDEYEYFKRFSHSNQNDKFLLYQVIVGLEDKIEKGWLEAKTALPRLNEELQQIYEVSLKLGQDMSTYFTTFQAMIDEIWKVSIVAPGRGSAGAFLLNFVLNITQINPLLYDFPLKRFLAAEKVSLADIDIDASSSKKDEILQSLTEWGLTFNTDMFSIATYGREKSKSALLTAARGLEYDPSEALYWASLIPSSRGFLWSLHEAYYGNEEDKSPVPEFVKEMNNNPDVWEVAQGIENLINKRSSHAAGVVFCNNFEFYKNTSLMKTPSGAWITQYDLEDLEHLGPTKYDLLSTKAVDAIQTELLLLAENGYIDWEGTLRATYDKYLHPTKLDYDDPRMWELINKKEVLSLFQFLDAPSGIQAIDLIQPTSLEELADINSVLRLMAADGRETPLNVYKKRKADPWLWYSEMDLVGLNKDEVSILESHVGSTKGMCITQEQLMALVQDPRISNFTFSEADMVRKVIGKKQMKKIPAVHSKFLKQGKEAGNREVFMNYIWNELFAVQLGYAFSIIHTISYSIIALQETHLNVHYPPIYWATARLLVEAGSIDFMEEDLELFRYDDEDEEAEGEGDEKKKKTVNYFKVSAAMGEIRSFGVGIKPPDINKSSLSFRADPEENVIYFGLKGITQVGDPVIRTIMENRPYSGLEDFMEKVSPNVTQITNLIKAGAFDAFGDRQEQLKTYCEWRADTKKDLNLRNMSMLVKQNLIPEELEFEKQVFRYNNHIRKLYLEDGVLTIPPEDAEFLNYFGFTEIRSQDGFDVIQEPEWKRFYNSHMDNVRAWIKQNKEDLLEEVNNRAVAETIEKYAKGNIAEQEMASLGYYYSFHELDTPEYKKWLQDLGVANFHSLPEDPVVEKEWQGRKIFELSRIAGTSIGRDKQKNLVGLETPSGFIKVKFYRSQFLKYDKQIRTDFGTEKSWFGRGQKLLLTGYRSGDQFIVKTYKNHPYGNPIYKFNEPGSLIAERIVEE